jgi:autophagy-related protein 16
MGPPMASRRAAVGSSGAAVSLSDFEGQEGGRDEQLLLALKARNERETLPFLGVFGAYERLRRENVRLRKVAMEQDREILLLRSTGQSAATLREVQEGLSRIQVHIAAGETNEAAAETAREQLRLMKEVQSLQAVLQQTADSLSRLQLEHGQSMAQISALEASLSEANADRERLKEELESVRNLLRGAEETSEAARAECQVLVARTMQEKLGMLNEMNAMNDEVRSLRSALHKRGAAAAAAAVSNAAGGGAGPPPPSSSLDSFRAHEREWQKDSVVPSRCFLKLPRQRLGVNSVKHMDSLLATAGDDGSVRLFDPASGQQRSRLNFAGSASSATPPAALCVAGSGALVAAGGSDGHVRIWNHQTGRNVAHFAGHQQRVPCISFCEGERFLVSASHDCSVKVWDVQHQWNATLQLMRARSKCNSLDVGVDSNLIITGHMDGSLRLWDRRSSSLAHTLASLHDDQILSVSFGIPRAGEQHILTCGLDGKLRLLDARTYAVISSMSHTSFRVVKGCGIASLSPDSRYACAGSSDHLVYVWEVAGGHVVAQLESHSAPVVACDWSPGSLSTCDKGGCVVLWR